MEGHPQWMAKWMCVLMESTPRYVALEVGALRKLQLRADSWAYHQVRPGTINCVTSLSLVGMHCEVSLIKMSNILTSN